MEPKPGILSLCLLGYTGAATNGHRYNKAAPAKRHLQGARDSILSQLFEGLQFVLTKRAYKSLASPEPGQCKGPELDASPASPAPRGSKASRGCRGSRGFGLARVRRGGPGHRTHILLKRNRSSQVKARSVVIATLRQHREDPREPASTLPEVTPRTAAEGRGRKLLPGNQLSGHEQCGSLWRSESGIAKEAVQGCDFVISNCPGPRLKTGEKS